MKKFLQQLPNTVGTAVREAAIAGAQLAKTQTFYTPRSPSGLQGKTNWFQYSPTLFTIEANTKYAKYVNNGTSPHIIPVGSKGFLAFRKNGSWIYTKKPVQHPGTKAYPFMTATLAFETKFLPIIVMTHIKMLIARLSK